jgi:hypothetical protein
MSECFVDLFILLIVHPEGYLQAGECDKTEEDAPRKQNCHVPARVRDDGCNGGNNIVS